MKLSSEAQEYADSYYWQKGREIHEEARLELLNTKFVSHENTALVDYNIRVNAAARTIEARLNSYLLAYEKEGKLIDDKDRDEILTKISQIIEQHKMMAFSGSQGIVAMVRNEWSESYKTQMKDYFDSKVRASLEPALNNFILKMSEMKMNKSMKNIIDKQYEVLRWIYDEAEGRQYDRVHLSELAKDNSNYTSGELEKISDYLAGEVLIIQDDDSGMLVHLTHKGIVEIQNSISSPQKATEHFSVPIIQNYNTFNASVASFQQGNQNVANVQQNFGSKVDDTLRLLEALKEHIPNDDKQKGLDYIEGIESEVKSEKSSESRMRLFLEGLGGIIKDTGKELLIEVGKQVITGGIQI